MRILVFDKKQMISIIFAIIVICGIISIAVSNKYIPVNVTPATGKAVVLDAGHGVPEDGICLTYFLKM